MKKLLATAAAAFVCCAAFAQAPADANAQAKELAKKLGRDRSAEGLETILSSKNVDLLYAYDGGFRETGIRLSTSGGYKPVPVPAEIEALMVRYYKDPVMGPPVMGLCGDNGMSCQTQALFDLMLAEWRTGKPRPGSKFSGMLNSQAPGVEDALIAWLGAADAPTGSTLDSVISQLGQRKSARAVPAITAALAKAPPGNSGNAPSALSQIATPAAAEALLARLEKLKRAPASKEVTDDSNRVAASIAQFPATVPVSYARLRAALPENNRAYSLQWLARKDMAALPDALVLLVDPSTNQQALNAVIASDSPEVWKQARAALKKSESDGRLQSPQYTHGIEILDAKIADPAKHMAEKQAVKKEAEFRTYQQLLERDLAEARKLKDSTPQAYVTAMREYMAAMEKLTADYPDVPSAKFAVDAMLRNNSMELGHYIRFRQKKPREALDLYATAQAHKDPFAALAIADTWQHDLNDKQRALSEYRKLAASPGQEILPEQETAFRTWMQRWLAAQVDYLATGKKFSGAILAEDMEPTLIMASAGLQNDTFGLATLMQRAQAAQGPGGKPVDRAQIQAALSALPASMFALNASMFLASYLPDAQSILAYFARQDPAGFTTACYFALLEAAAKNPRGAAYASMFAPGMSTSASDPMTRAKAQFLSERRINISAVMPQPADKRMSSPRATWDLFIASLRKGDLATAMSCLTPEIQARFRPLFGKMSPAEMRAAADSFKDFKLSGGTREFQEAFVVRADGHAGSVTFVNSDGSWKIGEM